MTVDRLTGSAEKAVAAAGEPADGNTSSDAPAAELGKTINDASVTHVARRMTDGLIATSNQTLIIRLGRKPAPRRRMRRPYRMGVTSKGRGQSFIDNVP